MANPLSMLFSELLSQQQRIYLGGSNNTENKEQLSIFYLSSQLQLDTKLGFGNIGISIARASQLITVFPYETQGPRRDSGSDGARGPEKEKNIPVANNLLDVNLFHSRFLFISNRVQFSGFIKIEPQYCTSHDVLPFPKI